ncbi:TetR/AcrR family transcriptional regulator C-terminal domain-containing protein [Streptomyces sp. PTM05]|uniref:TetR/AcrR family transcriptional regulator C-terminal domain-containing protein n=1 Tax=Streptantibioticus parmotrematis TaxID=2873249 RepID=A0ABS7QTD1_9ACTN|nr:TetR/AcrR family transcriptional regulator C-terminal domain-containing protein [Streptantibioticus parmotrematis]MBY8886453.1 TetR/AcrR family transcriptional regulator C-terminal domain-containing protein [Streptantibioticus parmotrematis]
MPLRRETVIEAGLGLLDEVGLDKLTTRALTTRLGVQPGALYWHVKDKRELLGAMAERVMDEAFAAPSPASGDWAEDVTAFAHGMRRALLAHRDGARLVATYTPLGRSALRAAEDGLALLTAAGVPLALAAHFGDTLTGYVTGFVMQEQAVGGVGDAGADLAAYPLLSRWAREGTPPDRDAAFASGVGLIVDGLRGRIG